MAADTTSTPNGRSKTSSDTQQRMQASMDIRVDDLSSPEILQLLREHLQGVALHSPPESIHALDLAALRKPEITF